MKGLLAKKLAMTQLFSDNGAELAGVTVLEAGPCYVTQVKTKDSDGYDAIQIGFGTVREERARKTLPKAARGHLGLLKSDDKHKNRKGANGMPALRHLREIRVEDPSQYSVGQKLGADVFAVGEVIQATGISKGKGFAGAVKRYHFRGGPKTHGQSDRNRAPGSSGATTTPGRVMKGLRRPGHMGVDTVTQPSLRVVMVDAERNLIALRGSVPGGTNSLVLLRETKRQAKKQK
ncbi:MAG: 50S ribosomal protein L3 [Chloroflexi bacterium]|nr:50S ribosomal protein L3 [Chloroflexota bacterium]